METNSFRYFVLNYSCRTVDFCRRSGSIGVVAPDLKSAIILAEQYLVDHFEVVIWNVSHHGAVHIIDQRAVDLLVTL